MRLRRSRSASAALRDGGRGDRRSPPGVVTSWLRQGLRGGVCPLCRVAHKADREYIWHFFDEGSDQGSAIDQLRAACGFCAEHIEMLRRIELEGMRSTLSISTTFADTFGGIVEDLGRLSPEGSFVRASCPACANREQQLKANARNLLDLLATSPTHRETFMASPGLCFAHFDLAWSTAETGGDRQLLLAVQRNAAQSLLAELREHVRKHDEKFRHEPKGSERDSWRRAIYLTAGWPPPTASAGEPETTE